jgi:diguanylate cyclase (GGDEF)-like protein
MKQLRGPLARLDKSRDELAKAWLMRLIERSSMEEIGGLPTERIARELPQLIGDVLRAVASENGSTELGPEQYERAAALAELRAGSERSAADLARDIAALQAVITHALREDLDSMDPEVFADTVERLAEVAGTIQAAAAEELVVARSRELESLANTDPLTGLHNLRYLQSQIRQLLGVFKRYELPFAVLLLDIDGLKRVNDAHGHQAGDRVLMQVAMSLRRSIRTVDTAARLGGDEFCVLAPNQKADAAQVLAERLAAAVEQEVATPEGPAVGISIGVVSCPEHGEEPEELMEVADRAMYRAKSGGESVSVGAPDEPVEEPTKRKQPSTR